MFPKETKILVVDDMVGMRKMIKGLLHDLGYRNIAEAENGQEAYDALVAAIGKSEPFGLVLSDWNMPTLSGIELLKLVRGHAKMGSLPFLLVTAEGQFNQVKDALKLKVSDYIVKPFTPAIIQEKLEGVWKRFKSG